MLIETRPIAPVRTGRARLWISILAPVILLGGVVTVAVAGTRDVAPPLPEALPVAVADVAEASASSTQAPTVVTTAIPAIAFPTRIYDLPVLTVDEALAAEDGVTQPGAIVAVRAWLTIRYDDGCARSPLAADGRPVPDALCWKAAILGIDPSPAFAWQDGAMRRIGPNGAHIHAQIPPGVDREHLDRRAIPIFGGGRRAGTILPIPVVVVGRFGDERVPRCTTNGRHCGESFVIERVGWVAGDFPLDEVVTFAPPIEGGLDADILRIDAVRAFPGPAVVLSQTLVAADDLDGIDPTAAANLANAVTADDIERLWFLRVMAPSGDTAGSTRTIHWLAIDDATGTIIATAPVD